MRSSCTSLVLAALTISVACTAAEPVSGPNERLTAKQAVVAQLSALARNNIPLPNSGVEIAFSFASPGNRRQTGPLDRFVLMVNSDPYRGLINHSSAEVRDVVTTKSHTLVAVRVITALGANADFVFVMNRYSTKDCSNCWMTDAVMPANASRPSRMT